MSQIEPQLLSSPFVTVVKKQTSITLWPHPHSSFQMPTISKTWRSNRNTIITLLMILMINIHTGLAENGLENLPCPSSLLLGVLVTLLPKVSLDFSSLHKWVYLLTHICLMRAVIIPLPQINNLCQKMVPRLMPYFLGSAAPEVKSRFSDPQYLLENEEVFR